ncbi:CAN8 protein, partial [Horornis vulcanius]|nr:CAN8 protein [Horornis vulcanius]
TYWTNPQFKIRLDEPDDDHAGSLNEPCCTILVGLMQKNRRRQKRMGEGLLSIGYSLYQVKFLESSTDVHAGRAFFARHQPAARTDPYVNLREVSSRMTLPRGQYLIVPSTFEPYKNGEFCLRVFAEKQAKSHDHKSMADGSSESSSSDGSSEVPTKHSAGNKIPQLCEG